MIEYINPGFILMGGTALFGVILATALAAGKAYTENRKTYALPIGFIIIIFIVVLVLSDGYSTKSTIDKNIALFQRGEELQCSTLTTTYLVSQQSGWRLRKEAFIKDSLLLDARYCGE